MKYWILPFVIFNFHYSIVFAFRVTFDNITFIISNVEPFKDSTVFHKDYPDKCYYSPTGHTWNVGDHWSPKGKCWVARCVKPGVAIVFYCGNVSPANDGHSNKYCQSIGMNIERPYPRCCNRYLCKSLNSRPYIYNPVVAGGGREIPNFKALKYSKLKKPSYKIILTSDDTCKISRI
ncbi:uncharacterized protein LOC129611432 [Condylostylus longicornis]|uniref:uncharacterized protein LOC129611432 n=1 Tax=Condylostylus longicornis TaxID=2530218 RepID=UPI00244DB61D|nr:uncharacterized protein LOC129611432 [Condylostylus longicornis]